MIKDANQVHVGDITPAGLPVRGVRSYVSNEGVDSIALVLEDSTGTFSVESMPIEAKFEVKDSVPKNK